MKLREVIANCRYEIVTGNPTGAQNVKDLSMALDAEITGIAYDSRKVVEGNIFVAIRGENFDGHAFINDAIKRGAVAVVHDKDGNGLRAKGDRLKGRIPFPVFIRVGDSREALACISNNFYERPSEDLSVIGVTGTNGKTTTTYVIKSILEAWDKETGLIGTINYLVKDRLYPAFHTTPESLEFQALLREMAISGCSHVVTEVSSHSLSQKRVDYTNFSIAVFTNLTRDHLDFHRTMENYYNAKKRLFSDLLSDAGIAVINSDDEWGRRLIEEIKGESDCALVTYGADVQADVMAVDIVNSSSGVSFTLMHRGASCRVDSPLLGSVNVYNILAASAVAVSMDIPYYAIKEGIRNIRPIRGRLERIDEGQGFLCIVDYAHTPDALERLILTARGFVEKKSVGARPRVITVFGCGGDRDRGKRPLMGEIASRLSDYVIITSDNPRSEDPLRIMEEIESGIRGKNYLTVPDRREAIAIAVERAEAGDIVLIAGKGHEDYQEIAGTRYRFSDGDAAREAIRNRTMDRLL